jgi:glycosyltransferase involved in cell wall biosynthesis
MVDDGSRDGSFERIKELAKGGRPVTAIRLRRNYGQTAALAAGIEHAKGDVIVTLDADLENDPNDIPLLLAKMDEGFDIVSGWRRTRWQGAYLSRKLPSLVANWLISTLSGVALHDHGCTLKAYRAELVKGINLYGDMHRFIAAYAVWQGGRIAEVEVSYTPRKFGKSNYGMWRIVRVLLDLVVMVFMYKYLSRPMHFFGGWGLVSFVLGIFFGAVSVVLKIFDIRDFVATPLPLWSALGIIVGIQLVMFGVMSELLMRVYYEAQHRRPWVVGDVILVS